ncbi:alpha/beta hydrolase, partial [Roseobacter sp.]|uniref:alpha/beta fold hydrolase n=1 Tax=Roseobacter sp. TaxID=1907202 RepID=UPI0032968644
MTLNWAAGNGRLAAGGATLEWACWGPEPGEGPVIVMLHEGLGCVALWRDFPARIAAATGLPVLAYSRAGYGQSDAATLPRPVDYMTAEAVDVLPDVLDAIGPGPVILMGHSDGATIAAEYAGRVADYRVRGLILMAPHFFTEPMGLQEIERARQAWETTNLRDRMGKYHANPEVAFCGWNAAWLNPEFRDWHVGEVIDYLRIPTLVVQGRDDQYGTLAQVREVEERSYAPVDVVVLDNCRHAPHQDHPDAVLA